jgi:hypothetical protein
MHLRAFCYFGLVKAPARLEQTLRLLPEAEREACMELIKGLAGMAPPQVRARWEHERAEERAAIETAAQQQVGGRLFALSGRLRTLLLRRTRWQAQES